ncbi:DUF3540 domain-containing protein [Polyangium sp. y55x31]|uniref:DUF3540 domain-containing protein n=1 Tax=Polyangium sp. y55x31 TaxID=3042688 RepID=UPI0024822B44|nr:DUF3540 domain-containing protein [Polyangium sp. y55x31]MDI1478102.1 DUF3540 domain-containing protein [Polyangium sp. y55x31]
MHNAARKLAAKTVWQEFGEVVEARPDGFCVRTALAEVNAKRAASCLVAPALGDRVLVATEEEGDSFVLAVLERKDSQKTTIAVEGDLELRTPSGKVEIAAQEGVDVTAAAPVNVTGSEVTVKALRARLSAEWIDVVGAAVKAEFGKVKMLASTFDAALDRFSQRVKRSYRTVEEIDQVRAQHIDWAAQGNAHLRGENTLVTATDLVKVNADQVHLG